MVSVVFEVPSGVCAQGRIGPGHGLFSHLVRGAMGDHRGFCGGGIPELRRSRADRATSLFGDAMIGYSVLVTPDESRLFG